MILVLWTFAVLAVLATEFARAMRDDAMATRNFKQESTAHYVAIAAINEALLAVMHYRGIGAPEQDVQVEEEPDPVETLNFGDGRWVKGDFEGVAYEVRVVDEGGKLGLNTVNESIMKLIFENLGYEAETVGELTDSIMDWRDEDDLHRVNGAEDDYYEKLPRPYTCKDGPFESIEELQLVRGVTAEIYNGSAEVPGLKDLFTVFNNSNRLNPRSVTPEVMIALSGITPEDARDLGDRRASSQGELPPELTALFSGSGVSPSSDNRSRSPTEVTVEARVKDSGGRVVSHLGALMHVDDGGDGFYLLRWYDSLFSDEEDEALDSEQEPADATDEG